MNTAARCSSVDLSWITPQLAVGSRFSPEAVPQLVAMGIRAVVDTRSEDRDDAELLARHGIAFRHAPIPDYGASSCEALLDVTNWLLDRLANGERVLVHCRHGIGRSVVVGCAVLMRQGESAIGAYRVVKDGRPLAAPNGFQFEALLAFERFLKHQNGRHG